jgi:hypothetical protein
MHSSSTAHDDKHAVLRPHPGHDWTSHAADACRYLAMSLDRQSGASGFNRRIVYPRHGMVCLAFTPKPAFGWCACRWPAG